MGMEKFGFMECAGKDKEETCKSNGLELTADLLYDYNRYLRGQGRAINRDSSRLPTKIQYSLTQTSLLIY